MTFYSFLILIICSISALAQTPTQLQNEENSEKSDSTTTNPYSPTYFQRRIALGLTASGAGFTCIGIAFAANPSWENALKTDGPMQLRFSYGTTFLIVGIIQLAVGIPFLIVSEISKSKYDNWEKTHTKYKVSFNGSTIVINF